MEMDGAAVGMSEHEFRRYDTSLFGYALHYSRYLSVLAKSLIERAHLYGLLSSYSCRRGRGWHQLAFCIYQKIGFVIRFSSMLRAVFLSATNVSSRVAFLRTVGTNAHLL